jgi:hypothetical protein
MLARFYSSWVLLPWLKVIHFNLYLDYISLDDLRREVRNG